MQNKITREDIINLIIAERLSQMGNPNTLADHLKTKNDWTGLAGYYLFESASRPDKHVSFDEFRLSLIKAAAVILAALETSFSLDDDNIKDLLSKLEDKNDSN
ncbi:hypothetical protein pEaSNUABM50_00212 [Erwinia phage pEa_SNUABM_50]|uniref:Uncharacterized protein n=4 Tax=Eneladusvirus BF TaxID=2560751 RepID=A0A7L8ZN31_9CAUD|nr:hypothetical protein FDH34_gp216 [Serratia phage BF]QOI71153.1 hypothetical protein pEaSNUABM12_00215 [Erwinia phage pEa_SNUABM_12]QOI71697.1 hypothetical protein pEaSNUABM47_00213 [Erwinia phage pEa_SNUABM_47]QOI72236.1 hypothetical protein pEaSNUABM50_00212 [Erwinia phage pEa_SNUABM_50]QXO11362.1 hypothetical protein pEaSNUABM19_00216 [Erwinia phage pEa_SNUABM_19]QXO11910.1 hypothetical protein pEaSNUABM44_00214 [Erwinia phage pEa_SNUABM_44]QXO12462.1 hypothetical protein pEaSNUABM49_002